MTDTKGIIPKPNEDTLQRAREVGAKIESWMTNPPKPGLVYFTPEQLQVFEAKYKSWYDAVTDQGVITHVGWDENDARKSLYAIIDWHVQVALDPKVSGDAEALIQRGRDEREAEIEILKSNLEGYLWKDGL